MRFISILLTGSLKRLTPKRIHCSNIRQQTLFQIPRYYLHHDSSTAATPASPLELKSTSTTNSNPKSTHLISKPSNSSHKFVGVHLTSAAIQQIKRVQQIDNKPNEVLRLSVESGGCHGFQYKMEFTDCIEEDDFLFGVGTQNGMVVIDESSLSMMDGSTIDFATELIGSSFRVLDNPYSAGKGCGCGVSWQLK